jgi:hypothetical protein
MSEAARSVAEIQAPADGGDGSTILSGFDEIARRSRDNPEVVRSATVMEVLPRQFLKIELLFVADLASLAAKQFTSAREVATIRSLAVEPALLNYSENPHLA